MPDTEAPLLQEALQRISAAEGHSVEVEYYGEKNNRRVLRVQAPAGKSTRTVPVFDDDIRNFLDLPFEDYQPSGTYSALINKKTGLVEASLDFSQALYARGTSAEGLKVWELPGVENNIDSHLAPNKSRERTYDGSPQKWRLLVSDDSIAIELSRYSPAWSSYFGRYGVTGVSTTLKIRSKDGPSGPSADLLLETFARDFLFDLDYKYGVDVRLAHAFDRSFQAVREPSSTPAAFPTNAYPQEAMSLYWYGAAAGGFPLLQFLAFYQVLEFFFPAFSRTEVIRRLQARLKDPAFDRLDERSVAQLVDLTAPAHRGHTGEREQLRSTLTACTDALTLRAFIENDHQLKSHFESKAQKIKNLRKLDLAAGDLLGQVADRIYDLRCRIVHTKDTGDSEGVELLLPTSAETRALGPEIELIKRIAQAAMIQGSRTR